MPLYYEALDRWPRATLLGLGGDAVFHSSQSGFERCLKRDSDQAAEAIALGRSMGDCSRLIVLGIGGSAMGLHALVDALAQPADAARLIVLDHLDLDVLEQALEGVDDTQIGLVIISRSGNTLEVHAWLRELLGRWSIGRVAVVTAAPQSALGELARERGWPVASIPDDVGGRFSVFTPCGLLPAAALGIDVEGLLRGAMSADAGLAHQWAADLKDLLAGGHDRWLQFFYGRPRRGLGGWWAQLLSESLGKAGLPLFVAVAEGPRDQHSILQLLMEGADRQALIFCRWQAPHRAPGDGPDLLGFGSAGLGRLEEVLFEANSDALSQRGRPVLRCVLEPHAEALGAWMQTWMRCTVLLASYLDLDPFDQPGVEAGKRLAKNRLGLS